MSKDVAIQTLRGDALAYQGQFNRAADEVELLISSPGVPEDVKTLSLNELYSIRTRIRNWLRQKVAA